MNKNEIISKVKFSLLEKYDASGMDDEFINDCIDKTLEAIDYTRCSTQLKNKEETAFDLWLKNFKKTEYGYWFDERTVYCYEAMKDIYKTSVKPKL